MAVGTLRSLLAPISKFSNSIHLRHFSAKPRAAKLNSQIQYPLDFKQKSLQRNLIPISSLLKRYGFPLSELHHFLAKNPSLLNSDPSKIGKSLQILFSLGRSQQFLTSLLATCPRVLDYEYMKKWEKVMSGIQDFNLFVSAIKNVLQVCLKFELDPDDALACLKCLRGLGFSEGTVIRVLEEFPQVVMTSPDRIQGKVEFLMSGIGIERTEVDCAVGSYPGVLAFGIENRLKPLLNEFKSLGFGLDIVRREVTRDPRILGLEVGELSHCLKLLRSLKCRVLVKEEIFRDGAFRAGYRVKLRVDCLHKHGLTYRDAYGVLWKEPRAILYEIGEIERKIQFLGQTMRFDIESLVDVPEYLGVNFEKQVVPRFKVIEYLRSKGGLGDEVGLRALIKPSRLKFYNLYVKPYPECESMYGRLAGDVKVKVGHPTGMWKLFKPPQYQQSKEDIMNIKSYMESLA
nr:transcription termination factor MTERF15, mitochondrial [Ipomoea batatas]